MKNTIIGIALALTAWSCSPSYQRCKDKFGGDTIVTFKDSAHVIHDTIYVKADTMGGEISLEDLLTNDYVKDSARQTIVIKYRDGKIKYVNVCKPQTIHETDTVYVRHTKYVTNKFKQEHPKIKWWWWLVLIAIIFVTAHLINAVKK